MTDNTKMREALIKFGDENPSLDLDFRLHTHGKYLTQEKAIVASRAFKAGAAWQAARTVPVVGEPVAWRYEDTYDGERLSFGPVNDDDTPLFEKPTTSITQAELDAKDARIRELEAANASLEASYRGSCMMYDATKVELKALRKDAERYRYLRKQHWSEAEICVVTNPKDAIKLGCYCPSSVRLDSAIDSAMQERQP